MYPTDVETPAAYVHPGLVQTERRDLHVVVVTRARTQAEVRELDLVHVECESRVFAGGIVILTAQVQRALGEFEWQCITQIRPDGARLQRRNLELAAGGERRQLKGATPLKALARQRGRAQRVLIAAVAAG